MAPTNFSPKVQLIILGFMGHMGRRALLATPLLREQFRGKLDVDVLAVADPHPGRDEYGRGIRDAMQLQFTICKDLEDALLNAWSSAQDNLTLVYDASPTPLHFGQLGEIARFQEQGHPIFYLGEKPLITNNSQLKSLKRLVDSGTVFGCDFIETENLASRAVVKYLRSHPKFKIEQMSFWRHGSTGLKKVFELEPARVGVTGGSLFDKSPHDLALAIDWLGIDKIEGFRVRRPKIMSLIPANLYTILTQDTLFMDVDGGVIPEPRIKITKGGKSTFRNAADAEFEMSVDWNLYGRRTIRTNYHFTWIGVTRVEALKRRFTQWGLPGEQYIGISEKITPLKYFKGSTDATGAGYRVEEMRVATIEGREGRERVVLICNLLAKTDLGMTRPRIWEVRDKSGLKELRTPSLQYDMNSLARMFSKAIERLSTHRLMPDSFGPKPSLLLHEVIIDAQTNAMRKIRESLHEANHCCGLFAKRLLKVPVPQS